MTADGRALQAALPREMYVDAGALGGRAGRRPLRRVVLRRPASTTSGWPTRSGCVAVDVAGESVVVTSAEDGSLHAAYNVCRHRGSQLCPPEQPARDAASLRCPYHSWTYALDGSLLRAPHASIEDAGAFALHPVGVETWQGFVFVHLTPASAEPLAAQVEHAGATLANYGIGDLVTGQVLRYDVAANYKVLLENYNECYHCGPVHPELSRLVPSFAGGGVGPRLGPRHPAPRGRLDVHDDRHDRPGAAGRASTSTNAPGTRVTSSTPT